VNHHSQKYIYSGVYKHSNGQYIISVKKCGCVDGYLEQISSADIIRRAVEEYVMSGEVVLLDFRGVRSHPTALRVLLYGLSNWADTQPGSILIIGMSKEMVAQLKQALT